MKQYNLFYVINTDINNINIIDFNAKNPFNCYYLINCFLSI